MLTARLLKVVPARGHSHSKRFIHTFYPTMASNGPSLNKYSRTITQPKDQGASQVSESVQNKTEMLDQFLIRNRNYGVMN
jgi:hypothetical protein